MVKLVIHCADIHVRNFQRLDEYNEQLMKFIEECRILSEPYDKDEVRIVISGDLMHQKNTISAELISFVSSLIRQLQEIAKVIVIAGNHDLIVNNSSRKDAITGLFETASFDNAFFLDYELDFQSGYIIDDNITWAVYSIYNDYLRPDIDKAKEEYPNNKVVGLYHGVIVGCSLYNGSVMDAGVTKDIFDGCDCVMAGDIHKRQELKRNDVTIVYPGSLIQQNYGETVTQHGFVKWNMESITYESVDLDTDYGMFDIEITSIDDIDNDKELLRNL
jgi:DNA repair exonuclease SbcCD nuclease subunit